MQRGGLASFVSGAALYLVPASPFHGGGPLHLPHFTSASSLARQHREQSMAGTITLIYHFEEPLPISRFCVTYRECPSRASWGHNDRGIARPAKHFFRGAPAFGACPGSHWAVRCHATGHRSPYSSFSLGQLEAIQGSNKCNNPPSVPLGFI